MRPSSELAVLVVDDERILCDAIADDFQRKGFNTFRAYNGRDAFEIVKSRPVDLVISDVRMPGGDGFELLTKVKSYNHALPVVMFITGFADMSLEQAYDMGADAVFAKPFNRKALMAAVENTLIPDDNKWGSRPDRMEVDAKIELTMKDFDSAIIGKIMNIGRGGIFVALNDNIPDPNSIVDFRIKFDQDTPSLITGEGIVRWTRAKTEESRVTGCGIQFVTLNPEAKTKILEWINLLKTKAFIPRD